MSRDNALLVFLLVMLALTSAVFVILPQLDIEASRVFWRGDHFLFQKIGIGAIFTVWLHVGMRAAFFLYISIAGLALGLKRWPSIFNWRDTLFIVASVALAAGLVTNVILKDHWGRARPAQVIEFGGTQQFTPAWVMSDQCDTNCSFVGGDVSFAFCGLAFALTVRRHRKLAVAAALAFGTLVGLGRLAAGAHFLSDCSIAAELTILLILVISRIKRIPLPQIRSYFP